MAFPPELAARPTPGGKSGDRAWPSATLTFVFVLHPTEYERLRARTPGPPKAAGGRLTAVAVVNGRHGVDPTHSIMLEVTGSPDAMRTFARGVAIDATQQRHLRRRLRKQREDAASRTNTHPRRPRRA